MTKDEAFSTERALDLALEALEEGVDGQTSILMDKAITAIKQARSAPYVASPRVQEPVAWGIIASNTGRICQVELDADEIEGHNPNHIVPLYTTPPAAQRQWVGLTDEDIIKCTPTWGGTVEDVARAIEAKLRSKNNG
jgi:hypothetical protein